MKKILYWLLPVGWMGIIFISSSTPYENQDIKPLLGSFIDFSFLEPLVSWITFTYNQSLVSVDALGINGFIEFFIRKGAHFGVFFVLLCLFYFAIVKTTHLTYKKAIFISFLLSVAYAITDELHQGMTPNRTPYVGDVIIDSIGAGIAILCISILRWWKMDTKN
ncbi:VanZ family protein [Oceanobacillus bengalensis]|uniref:VanZ family protein n=1 Tax=Oceanobacillus bengalensis TaxID=1435466 RepID=A0A494Z855_9BACI|nr:VanZ family protein [Oceanobacillus bengalensis]RKQ18207.1 VanZ family protein [Oceanobacillus bengalensis]